MSTALNTNNIMLKVILALLPGTSVLIYFFDLGIIYNILFAILFSVSLEALCLKLRDKNVLFFLKDYSAIVTGILLAVCLPPYFNLPKIFIGIFFAIVITKHLYGGLGHNIFNPAMIGFAALLIAFPQDFTNWQLANNFMSIADDISQATPLDPIFSNNNKNTLLYYYLPYYLINSGWLIGSFYLIYRKILISALYLGFISGLIITSSLVSFNPLEQLFLGGSMLGAFFIITDPVTAPTNNIGRWLYSFLAGSFCILIRKFCGYPDGVAFSIIFMNTWVPLINKITIHKSFIRIINL